MDKELFKKLREKRLNDIRVFQDPDYPGVFDIIKDLYKSKTHFIYELLQNADDAKATIVRFSLFKDRLVFTHNGSERFSISDPEDTKKEKGHINSITSIGASTKSGELSDNDKIGKFGIGFKSVFSFTSSPEIYDDDYQFTIVNYIVPDLLKSDFPHRKKGETVFQFPFNIDKKPAQIAYDEIKKDLLDLNHPLLFLNSINKIEWEFDGKSGYYQIHFDKKFSFSMDDQEDVEYSYFQESVVIDKPLIKNGIKLSRYVVDDKGTRHKYSIVFFMNGKSIVNHETYKAYCFFRTEVSTDLRFMIHAPFLITYSRETIKDDAWNIELLDLLASLSADCIDIFRKEQLISESLFRALPIYSTDNYKKSDAQSNANLNFNVFTEKLIDKLKLSSVSCYPSMSGNLINLHEVCIARGDELIKLLNSTDLQKLLSLPNANWVFGSLNETDPLFVFMQSKLKARVFSSKELPNLLPDEFLQEQSPEWLNKLYLYIKEVPSIAGRLKLKPIVRIENKDLNIAPFSTDKPLMFLPSNDKEANTIYRSMNVKLVSEKLLQNTDSSDVLKHILLIPDADQYASEIIQNQSDQFWQKQPLEWLIAFYRYVLSDRISLIEIIKYKPIIRISPHTINSSPYDKDGNPLVYLKSAKNTNLQCYSNIGVSYLDPKLLEDKLTRDFLKNHLQIPEVKEHEVFRNILIQLFKETGNDAYQKIIKATKEARQEYCDFVNLLSNFVGCYNNDEIQKFYDNLRTYPFLVGRKGETRTIERGTSLYYPSSFLTDYYSKQDIIWLDIEFYDKFIEDKEYFQILLDYAGVKFQPVVTEQGQNIDGLVNYLNRMNTIDQSISLINLLIELVDTKKINTLNNTKISHSLNAYAWLFNFKNEKLKPCEVFRKDLNPKYESIKSPHKDHIFSVINFQEFSTSVDVGQLYSNFIQKAVDNGHNENEIADFLETVFNLSKDEYSQLKGSVQLMQKSQNQGSVSTNTDNDEIELFDDNSASSVIEDIKFGTAYEEYRSLAESQVKYSYNWFINLINLEIISSGENSRKKDVTLYFDKIEPYSRSNKMVVITNKTNYIPSIVENLADFRLNLTLKDGTKKELRVDAASRRVDDKGKYPIPKLLLKFIPEDVEKYHNIKLEDVVLISLNIKDPVFLLQELLERYKELPNLSNSKIEDDYNFHKEFSREIRNLSFIYGPPGTGKTTYLAERIICDLLDRTLKYKDEISGDNGILAGFAYRKLADYKSNLNILVLTPTNKAADVLAEKVIQTGSNKNNENYKNYLVRFETTDSESIEREASELILERNDNSKYSKMKGSVVVTTIHRFAYDGFKSHNNENIFRNKKWDLVIFDEASMIPIAYIIYTIYCIRYVNEHCPMIIAGDPFQIPPVQLVDIWSNENIYSFCGLKSFNPNKQKDELISTLGSEYPICNLTTQYRSINSIGELFSQFSYDAMLTHYRKNEKRILPDLGFKIDDFTVVQYPVNSNNLLYKSSRLKKSPYHPYSVLFTVELIEHMLKKLDGITDHLSIGIISPYRVQADLAGKIIASKFPVHEKIKISVATVHGFQGDECDIVICLFNAPAGLYQTSANRLFINNQNILNVAISRARDYLILLVPDYNTKGYQHLLGINKILKIMEDVKKPIVYSSKDMELILKKNSSYVSENTFITTHQLVNVYTSEPESYYEFRISDEAVDVQIFETE